MRKLPEFLVLLPYRMKRKENDAESTNVADSRLGPNGNVLSRQDEVNARAPDAQNVGVKQEVVEAAVDCNETDRLAQDIVREAAKLEHSCSPRTEGMDRAPTVDTATVTDTVVTRVSLRPSPAEVPSESPASGSKRIAARSHTVDGTPRSR